MIYKNTLYCLVIFEIVYQTLSLNCQLLMHSKKTEMINVMLSKLCANQKNVKE